MTMMKTTTMMTMAAMMPLARPFFFLPMLLLERFSSTREKSKPSEFRPANVERGARLLSVGMVKGKA